MSEIELLWQIGAVLVPLFVGYTVGRYNEHRHYRSIRRREASLKNLLAFAEKSVPRDWVVSESRLVVGSVVISVDYFKRFLAGLRAIIGGRIDSYESLVERARREAILRMKEEAAKAGADMVFNVKLETARVFQGERSATTSVEALAYGTALRVTER
jgi:uncharacterized protein YbjQ (UPF0145 family)